MKRQTIRDVAAAAGVSIATVSRTLAPDKSGRVSENTRRLVFSAVETLGYRTNHAARSLKTRSTRTIGIVAPELANDFFMELAEGIEGELDAHGYTLLIASSANSGEEEKKRLSVLADRMVDGMVVIPAGARGDHLKALAGRGLPVVLVDRLVEGADLDAVLSDNEGGAFELTRALLADGYRRIAFIGGDITISTARERLSGFGRALAEGGIRPEPDWIRLGGMGVEDGYRGMDTILKFRRRPEALVAVNLLVHLGMERCLLDHNQGSREKEPLVIAGFDETVYTPFLPACRYIAAQDAMGIGKQAVQRILERIALKKNSDGSEAALETTGGEIIRLPVKIIRHRGKSRFSDKAVPSYNEENYSKISILEK
ncbi:MAG: LacI family transcriptional regulator [Spirochaetaceae bacterium]|jgi:LacI family transcriptional regulator|nr:LacI family transcriptional regulator [Spirochaetaceae bacterium]